MFEQRKRRTKQKSSVRYIFAKSIEIYGGLWYNKHRLKSLVFCRSPDVADTTFDTTLKVEWVELTEYSPKSDIKTHENAPQRPQLKDVLSNGNNSTKFKWLDLQATFLFAITNLLFLFFVLIFSQIYTII